MASHGCCLRMCAPCRFSAAGTGLAQHALCVLCEQEHTRYSGSASSEAVIVHEQTCTRSSSRLRVDQRIGVSVKETLNHISQLGRRSRRCWTA